MLSITWYFFSSSFSSVPKMGSSGQISISGSTASGSNSAGWTSAWFPVGWLLVGSIIEGGGTM